MFPLQILHQTPPYQELIIVNVKFNKHLHYRNVKIRVIRGSNDEIGSAVTCALFFSHLMDAGHLCKKKLELVIGD